MKFIDFLKKFYLIIILSLAFTCSSAGVTDTVRFSSTDINGENVDQAKKMIEQADTSPEYLLRNIHIGSQENQLMELQPLSRKCHSHLRK